MVARLALRLRLGAERVIWVDPRKVRFHVGTNEPATQALKDRLDRVGRRFPPLRRPALALRQAVNQSGSWVIAARHYRIPEPIEEEERHRLVADLLLHRDRPQDSLWHAALCRRLERRGGVRHKSIRMRSRAEIDAFFRDYALALIESLETAGYDPVRGGAPGTALIGPDGDLHKAHSGNHRFCAARLLGVTGVPVAISGVHADWYAREVGPRPDLARLRAALRRTAERFR